MTLHPRLTRAAVTLVKRFETFQPRAEPTPAGGWSIGYGHTRSAREGARIGEADAEALLIYDLDVAARAVERALFAPVSQSQFEALTALCFNLGEAAFLRSSALARVNAGAELDAADEIERWRRAELGAGAQVVDALVRRRAAEKAHFLGLPEGEATWPSAQLRPLASPGGEGEAYEPSATSTPSAAMMAADGVQARLRRLIPEDAPAVQAGDLPAAGEPGSGETRLAAADPADAWSEPPGSDVVWERTPPPFDPPAGDRVLARESEGGPRPDPTPGVVATADAGQDEPERRTDATGAPPSSLLRHPRAPYAAAGLLGAVLFVAALVMILAGRTGVLDLGLGTAGVLLAASALYGLSGGARPPVVRSPDAPGAGRSEPSTRPFPDAARDTK